MRAELSIYKIVENPSEASQLKALFEAKGIYIEIEKKTGNLSGLGFDPEYQIKIPLNFFGLADQICAER